MSVLSALVLLLVMALSPTAITGVVVDVEARPIPRASIAVIARDGTTAATIFTEADGTFAIASAPDGCRLRAWLAGFQPASVDCRTGAPLKVTLTVAPIAEHIVVSPTRTHAPSGQVASAVTVFDAEQIERRQEPPLADLLRQAPGTTIVRVGAPGSVTSLFVRGGESNYTKVLLDGIPLNEPGGAFNMSNISTENLERVEFMRGAHSAVYGSDAMTGVLQLFTRRGVSARPAVRLNLEAGSFATARGAAGVSARAGRLDYSIDVAQFTTDNEVPNNHFRNTTLSGSAGVALGAGAVLRVIGRAERGLTGVPGASAFARPDRDAFFRRRDSTAGIAFVQTSGSFHHRAAYGLATSHQESTNRLLDPPYTPSFEGRVAPFAFSDFPYDSRTDLKRHHASYQADATIATGRAGTHVETALVEWDGERADLRDALAGPTVPARRDNVGVTLQHQALWSHVFVTAGLRVERNDSFGTATVPRVAAAWYPRRGGRALGTTRVSASAGTGIKEPTLLQSFSPSPFFQGNPELQPERTRSVEAGVEQRLAADRVRLTATWFDNRYRGIISLLTDQATFLGRYFNIGLTTARGAELSGDVALTRGLRASAGYTFTDSEIIESTSASVAFQEGNWAFRRPRHSGFFGVAWNGSRASVDLSGSIVGRRIDSDFASLVPPMLENDAFAALDLRGSVRLTRGLSGTLAIDNLTDSDRMEPLGYPVLGRAIRAGIRARF